MRLKDLRELPKVRDSWSHLYVEHCKVDREQKAIAIHDAQGLTPVPCASLSLLMLGPGTSITHAAIQTLADSGCLVTWTGEQSVRFYALGLGETRQARNLLHQARLCTRKSTRLEVCKRMYRMRFAESLPDSLPLKVLRGKEGVRVRDAYAKASRLTGVSWKGRQYNRGNWRAADPVNRALSCANSCLYGVCHSAITAAGYSPALGFIHIGKQLSFVYDIADLYKADITIPLAFKCAIKGKKDLERRVRTQCRDGFVEHGLLKKIVSDLAEILDVEPEDDEDEAEDFDVDPALPGKLWDPGAPEGVEGGVSYGSEETREEDQ